MYICVCVCVCVTRVLGRKTVFNNNCAIDYTACSLQRFINSISVSAQMTDAIIFFADINTYTYIY